VPPPGHLLTPSPTSASLPAALPSLKPPRVNCIGGREERETERKEEKLREEIKRKEEKKRGEEKKRKKKRERKTEINYLFVEKYD
jgi:hypothetical protein